MAFTFALNSPEPFSVEGNFRVVRGTYTNSGGSTGGDIITGLNQVHDFQTMHTGVATANADTVNGTFPIIPGTVTIVTDADVNGIWTAKGR